MRNHLLMEFVLRASILNLNPDSVEKSLDAARTSACATISSLLLRRKPRLLPRPPAAIERDHVLVSHLLQRIRRERRAESATTVEHHAGASIRRRLLDIALDDAFAQVNSARRMTSRPFGVLAHVDQ